MKKIFSIAATLLVMICAAVPAHADGYNRIFGSWNDEIWNVDGDIVNNNGIGVGYLRGIGLTPKIPLYLEVGGTLTGGWGRYEGVSTDIFTFQIPVNCAYQFEFAGGDIHLSPYAGFNFKFNIGGDVDKENIFDSDGVNASRFQPGFHIGCHFSWKKLYTGMQYGFDFNKLASDCSTTGFSWNIGVVF
ncbi:MAG: hypothetical protein K2M87_04185 [Muribaculaceae bacterium]|nr:hypothetical protein [Muribaculaceae bacterium]